MELKKKTMVIRLSFLLFLLAFDLATVVEARFDTKSFITQVLSNGDVTNYNLKSTTTACCDDCSCAPTYPSMCRCFDAKETCHSACINCICSSPSFSLTKECICFDSDEYCYEPCTSN